MGLAVSTGVLADLLQNDAEGAAHLQEQLGVVNRVLADNGLPAHQEPTQLPPTVRRDAQSGFPYSYLHHLRRAYAHAVSNPSWKASPFPPDADPADDPVLEEEAGMLESHLLCHSDAEGFYVPADFDEVLMDEQGELAGGLLGSTHALQRELATVAPALGIELVDGVLGDAQVAAIQRRIDQEDGLHIELMVWLCLFEACKESIAHRTAIGFN